MIKSTQEKKIKLYTSSWTTISLKCSGIILSRGSKDYLHLRQFFLLSLASILKCQWQSKSITHSEAVGAARICKAKGSKLFLQSYGENRIPFGFALTDLKKTQSLQYLLSVSATKRNCLWLDIEKCSAVLSLAISFVTENLSTKWKGTSFTLLMKRQTTTVPKHTVMN